MYFLRRTYKQYVFDYGVTHIKDSMYENCNFWGLALDWFKGESRWARREKFWYLIILTGPYVHTFSLFKYEEEQK